MVKNAINVPFKTKLDIFQREKIKTQPLAHSDRENFPDKLLILGAKDLTGSYLLTEYIM